MHVVNVVLPIPLCQTFDYLLLSKIEPIIGARVKVPFGRRQAIGIIIAVYKTSNIALNKLKPVDKVLDDRPIFSDNLWKLLHWAVRYYHHPIGEVLFHALPILLRKGKLINRNPIWQWCITERGKNTPINSLQLDSEQKQALAILLREPIDVYQKNRSTITDAVMYTLRAKGLCDLSVQSTDKNNWQANLTVRNTQLRLNIEQNIAVEAICNESKKFTVWLLAGITGSGKTEVYLTAMENVLLKGKQALVLVPEISLTPQTITRFRNRFDAPIEVLHSKLSASERLAVWLKARDGKCAIVIGTRSALFTPFLRLGIIIVDEEHDSSYKQHVGWRYHARDLAVFRAKQENIPIVLGSATPSLETLYNVQRKKYRQLNLTIRTGSAKLTNQSLVNIMGVPLVCGLSTLLIQKICTHLDNGNQVMLFLNRRGFAPILLCHECGWVAECRRCDHFYTLHQHQKKLCCHFCNNQCSLPHQCIQCGSTQLIAIGLGTERLEKILQTLFSNVPVTRIDRDTTGKKGVLEKYLHLVKQGGPRILIGTQMLAKGHHFPDVTLVTLLEVDGALLSSDFRATERFAQLYTQVSGRAGRADKPGEVLLQTHYPEHPLLKDLLRYGYLDFARNSLEERREAKLPPFINHVLFRAEDYDNYKARSFLKQLQLILDNSPLNNSDFWCIGPNPALAFKRNSRFHWQLLLSHSSRRDLQQLVAMSLPDIRKLPLAKKVKWSLDVDPIDS